MRVIVVGTDADRAGMRAKLSAASIEVVAEFATLATAHASDVVLDAIDGVILASERFGHIDLGNALADRVSSRPVARSDAGERDAPQEPLTPREVEVIELLAEGLPNKTIAARLGISDQTVKFHVASIYGKLGAANRTDAVRRAVRRGLITL